MYKRSRFNIVIDERYLWNTRTGALATLTADDLIYYNTFSGIGDDSDLFALLKTNKFLIPEEIDELGVLLKQETEIFTDVMPSDLYFVIAPTLNCNYKCEYCFESQRDIYADMSEETARDVICFVERKIINNDRLKRLHITFFGGEPLLKIDILDMLSGQLHEICNRNNIKYRPTIITNGRYIYDDAILIFKRDKFKSVQISMDAVGEKYCMIRGASINDFNETIQNIINVSKYMDRVIVRINVRNGEFRDARQVVDALFSRSDEKSSLKVYAANVNEGEKDTRLSTHIKYIEGEQQFKAWVSLCYGSNHYFNKRPLAKGVSCRLSCDSNFGIGPLGELYKCDYHFGKEQYAVGTVKMGYSDIKRKEFHTIARHGKEFEKCKECSMVPICMGGCINNKIQGEKITDCSKFIEQMIRREIDSYTVGKAANVINDND